jgi:hypothetical protein
MNWILDATGRTYKCRLGSGEALIWRSFTAGWIALICQGQVAIGHSAYPTLTEAQAWCEAQLAEHRKPRA